MSRSISKVSMDIVDQTIAEVNGLNNSGQSEPQAITLLPNFLPILDYLSAVQSFYRDNNINSQNINDQTNLVNHLNQIVQDNHLMEKSNNSQDQQSNEANVRNSSQNEQTEAVRDQDRQQLNSVSSARKDFYENNNNLRYPSQISQDQIADAMINAQQQEQQHNSDKNIQEQFNSPSNISNSNNPQQDTEKADKNGNNKKKNIISEQRYSQPMHLERQTVPKQVVQQQIIHNKQNTPKTNDFEEHSMNSKNQTKSTRHNRLTNFTSFKAHARSKTLLATPTSINQNTNCSNGLTRTNQFVKDTELDTLNERQTKINNSNVVSMVEREQQGRNNMGNDRTNIHNPHQQDPLKQLNETHNKNRLCQIMELRVRKPRVRSVVGGMIRGELSTASKWTESKLEYSDLNRLHLREALSQLDNEVTMLQTTQSRVLFHETRQLRAASQSDCRQKEFDDLMFAKQERDRLLAFQQAKHNQERQLLHDQSVSTIAMIRQSKPQSTQQKQQQLYQKQQNQQNSNYNHNNDKSTNIYNPEAARIPTDISTWLHTSQGMNTERAERECWHNEMMKGSFEQSMSRLTGITNTTTRGTSQNGTRQMKLYLEESSVYSENQMKDVISSIKASQLKHAVLTSNLSHTLSLLKLNDQSRFSLLKNK